jgi:hypothetical protein
MRHFNRLLQNLFPNGNGIPFCNAIFRTFGSSESRTGQYLEFRDFLKAMDITNLNTDEVQNCFEPQIPTYLEIYGGTGGPDWANFCQLVDCLLLKNTELAQLLRIFFQGKSYGLLLSSNGLFFTNLSGHTEGHLVFIKSTFLQ